MELPFVVKKSVYSFFSQQTWQKFQDKTCILQPFLTVYNNIFPHSITNNEPCIALCELATYIQSTKAEKWQRGKKIGRIVERNVLNNILKVFAYRRWAGAGGGQLKGAFSSFFLNISKTMQLEEKIQLQN